MNLQSIQAAIVAVVVLASILAAARSLLPAQFRRLQSGIARALSQPRRSRALRALGRRLQPAEAKAGACGSGMGCASCRGCPVSEARAPGVPLIVHPRRTHGAP